ncbi:hypothetical protein CB0940_09910 [Cercospora beticola]|uniref:BRCT domain-containing protein n=1 Tax=Cercospora beticola TaxID=122368 RepID=A0A2G5HIP1_CERBT|nr:hypothetical protein CB0940_09910 [Cercospora beticola]PIA92408.1 hypothetical protein CB0940_09910 [Cercospora beticola]WPB05743.1 hypothetical protein RHO25_010397 [Cercospora beticola]
MASLTESSMGSVPIEELRAAALRLDQYKEPSHGAQVVSADDLNGQQSIAQDSNASDEAGNSKGATVPESIEQRIPNDSLPRARERLHAAPVSASPVKMPALREGEWVEIPKAASFMEGGGDTQPWASQAVLETSKSMIADGQTTPQRPHTVASHTPNTYCSTVDGHIDLGIENMPSLTSQAGYGSYGRNTDMAESAAVAASPTTSQAENDLLREDTQPQTEARTSSRDFPATPALAGQKRARTGELLTSVTTISKTPHYSQYFRDGEKPPTMTNTQLFRATDSSPLSAPPSDPILSRPSPHTNGFDRPSSPTVFSSPELRRPLGRAASLAQPEPMTRYISMKESQEMRRQRIEAAKLNGKEGEVEDEIDEFEDSWDRRPRRGIPRPRPHSEHLSRVTAPARSSSRSRSAHDAIEIKDTPDTSRKASEWNDFVVGFAVGPQQAIEDEDEDQEMAETQDLPEECNVQFSERDDPGVSDAEPEEHGDVEIEDVDNDEYDEFGQGLRSQADDIAQDDDDMAAEAPAEQGDVTMEDVDDPRETEHAAVEKVQSSARTSQRSAVANSQPTATHPDHPSASQQAVQYSSYVPGSQHQGRTSEDTALLRAPHASEQSRVAASQLQTEESTETSVSGNRIPSSPPVQVNANPIYDDHVEASKGRPGPLGHAEQAEVQESDVIENGVSELHSANGPDDSVPLYSTARTHVSGSAPSPARNKMVGLSQQLGQSQRSKSTDQSPSIRRFADFAASGSMPMNHSMGIDYSQPDVVALVDTLFTAEDKQVHDLMSDDHVETPRTKRVKRSHKNSSITAISPHRRSGGEGESTEINALQESDAGAALTIDGPFSTEAGAVSEGQNIVEAASVEFGNARSNAMESRSPSPPPALMDSPSKANQMLAVLTDDEDEKTRESTTESVRIREEAGRAAVSQLVSLRTSTKGKKSKQKTYSRGSRRKSAKSGVQASGRTSTARALTPVSGDDEPHDSEQQAASDQGSAAIPSPNLETTPISAEEGEGQPSTQSRATRSSTSLDLVGAGADVITPTTEPVVVAPERVFVLFKGTPQHFYPATWLGASPDHTTYKVKFDDNTVTNIEYYHVRRLELRLGDVVKVDDDKKRKKNWVVVGFGPVATTDEERALGTDIYGHTHVKVQLKGDRESLSKSTSSEAADVTQTVLVNLLYLTFMMWHPFKDRAFEPPSDAITTRPSTPTSARTSTPSAAGSPSSRPRRAYAPSAKTKSARPSNLRETSLASSSATSSTSAIFDGMAFAISYVTPDEEKQQVTDLIQQHGGTVLEEGFEELFDLPDINGKNAGTPSKKSPRRKDHAESNPGLQLKSKFKDLKFAALIADRHSRRAKYMQALALGLPTISGRWILHSLESTKNPAGDQSGPLPWDRYLLPAGESTYLNAVRSRSLTPYDAATAVLSDLVENRMRLLRNESLILVAPKTGSANMEKRKTFAFLTLACGAGRVKRVYDIAEAKKLTLDDPDTWKWVYVDSSVAEAEKVLFGRAAAASKKKKRGSEANNVAPEKMSATDGVVKLVNDEFVIQSLILEALVE